MQKLIFLFLSILYLINLDATEQKTLGIYTYIVQGVGAWDPDHIKQGITGSEEAVIYVSQKLAEIGYKVLVFGNPPQNSRHSDPDSNPRYVHITYDNQNPLDIAISWRNPHNSETLKSQAKKIYLWPHDTISYQLSEQEVSGFDGVLWLSQWQRQQWTTLNPGLAKYTTIFGNGVNIDQFKPIQNRINPHSCIYGSNYARGLEILLDIWPKIKEQFPKASLDIYYGWQHWGLLSKEKEQKMREQVKDLSVLDVRDHGLVGHEELNRAYEKASLWTYPCIGLETFCITAIRAQLAGAIPVIIEGSALHETVKYGFSCQNSEEYTETLIKAMHAAESTSLEKRKEMGSFILNEYQWNHIAQKWKELFDSHESELQ